MDSIATNLETLPGQKSVVFSLSSDIIVIVSATSQRNDDNGTLSCCVASCRYSLMSSCWSFTPAARPTFDEICRRLSVEMECEMVRGLQAPVT